MAGQPIVMTDRKTLSSEQAIRHIEQEVLIGGERVTRIHTVWMLTHGAIMVHEYNSCNRPSSTICFFDSIEEYADAIENIDWISNAR